MVTPKGTMRPGMTSRPRNSLSSASLTSAGRNGLAAWAGRLNKRHAPMSHTRVFMIFSRYRFSEKVALQKTKLHQLGILDGAESVQAVSSGQRLRRIQQRILPVVAGTDHGKHDAVPATGEVLNGHLLVSQDRIADIYPVVAAHLHHHKVLVAPDIQQHYDRYLSLFQLLWLKPLAPCSESQAFGVALHVQHGKPHALNQLRVCLGEHAFDYLLLAEIPAVGFIQQGGHGGCAAAEIGLLLDQSGKSPLAHALHGFEGQSSPGQDGQGFGGSMGAELSQAKNHTDQDHAHAETHI